MGWPATCSGRRRKSAATESHRPNYLQPTAFFAYIEIIGTVGEREFQSETVSKDRLLEAA